MKREELLRSKEYWIAQIQNNLFHAMHQFMKAEGLNKTQLAAKLNVSKGYITQVLNGDFDHKISKLVELSLACNEAPLISFINLDRFIKEDEKNKVFIPVPMLRSQNVVYEMSESITIDKTANKETHKLIKYKTEVFPIERSMTINLAQS